VGEKRCELEVKIREGSSSRYGVRFTVLLVSRVSIKFFLSKIVPTIHVYNDFNHLKPELNPICYLLALSEAHHFLHVSRIRVKLLTLR